MKRKTYVFDFDGTLIDSVPMIEGVFLRMLHTYGAHYDDPKEIVKTLMPLGYLGSAKYSAEKLGATAPAEELVASMRKDSLEEYRHRIPAKKGVAEGLRALKEQGASLNVLTATPHLMIDPCLARLGLWELFDNVWSCEEFSTTKADPHLYELVAERLGEPLPEVIFVDDNVHSLRTAKAAGMRVFGVFDEFSADMEQEIRSFADGYLFDLSEFLNLNIS